VVFVAGELVFEAAEHLHAALNETLEAIGVIEELLV
jgi:hypothetical protein